METTQMSESQIILLRQQIRATEAQLQILKAQLAQAESRAEQARLGSVSAIQQVDESVVNIRQNQDSKSRSPTKDGGVHDSPSENSPWGSIPPQQKWPLESHEYRRYGRQLIMPELGLPGQLRLKSARVLIVGVGGLGCPAAAYLAGAGVGTIGLVDGDTVEESNLHRQIAHSTAKVDMTKVKSAYEFLTSLNPCVDYRQHPFHITPDAAIDLFEQYDLILDCTDHPTSRYLISDACVLTGRPLVSASALKTEGQLIVLNNPPHPPGDISGGPCYRCIFPRPPPPESITSCSEGGILGPVVGVMGVLQALEAIKVLTTSIENARDVSVKPSLLMFSAYSAPPFRSVRMRSRRPDCAACSTQATITRQGLQSGSLDYVAFCGTTSFDELLPADRRIDAVDFARLPQDGNRTVIDVRDETQYAICALQGSVNVPWTGSSASWIQCAEEQGVLKESVLGDKYLVCRLGNDSQLAAMALIDRMQSPLLVKDIKGGFKSWRSEVDPSWPDY